MGRTPINTTQYYAHVHFFTLFRSFECYCDLSRCYNLFADSTSDNRTLFFKGMSILFQKRNPICTLVLERNGCHVVRSYLPQGGMIDSEEKINKNHDVEPIIRCNPVLTLRTSFGLVWQRNRCPHRRTVHLMRSS